jgi:hypothetical protein
MQTLLVSGNVGGFLFVAGIAVLLASCVCQEKYNNRTLLFLREF